MPWWFEETNTAGYSSVGSIALFNQRLGNSPLDLEFPTCQKVKSEISYQQISTELRVLSTELPERDTLLPHPLHPQKRTRGQVYHRSIKVTHQRN